MTTVTVLMSTYNGEKYLTDQIDSIINQKSVNVKLIVRDDGSTDNTIKILRKYEKEGKLKYYCGKNLKPALSFIDLIFTASGSEYYAFSDQDDIWYPNKLIEAIKSIDDYKDKPVLYYGSHELINNQSATIGFHILDDKRSPFARFIINQAAGCTMVFNQLLLDAIKKHKPNYIHMHDNWTLKVCQAIGGIVYVDKNPYIKYRQHDSNAVGLDNSLVGKIKRSLKIIKNGEIQSTIEYLYSLYGDEMTDDYAVLCKEISLYKKSIIYKIRLLINKRIIFKSLGLRLTFMVMIIFNKL